MLGLTSFNRVPRRNFPGQNKRLRHCCVEFPTRAKTEFSYMMQPQRWDTFLTIAVKSQQGYLLMSIEANIHIKYTYMFAFHEKKFHEFLQTLDLLFVDLKIEDRQKNWKCFFKFRNRLFWGYLTLSIYILIMSDTLQSLINKSIYF